MPPSSHASNKGLYHSRHLATRYQHWLTPQHPICKTWEHPGTIQYSEMTYMWDLPLPVAEFSAGMGLFYHCHGG